MVSSACEFEHGRCLWSIIHDAQDSLDNLSTTGTLPPTFDAIRERTMRLQSQDKDPHDYIFGIPVETAESICGYRYDKVKFDWGKPVFTILEPIRYQQTQRPASPPSASATARFVRWLTGRRT